MEFDDDGADYEELQQVEEVEEVEEEEETASFGELLRLAGPEKKWIFLGCLALLLRLPFSLASPHFQAEALGAAIDGDRSSLKKNVLFFAFVGGVNALLDFWNVFFFDFAKARLLRRLRTKLFSKIMEKEMAFFDRSSTGWLASRLSSDTAEMGNDLTWVFRWSIESVVRIVGIVTYMFLREWQLAVLCVAVVPPVTLVNYVYGRWLRGNACKVQTKLADAGGVANEAIASARTVLSCCAETLEELRYAGFISEHYSLTVKQAVAQASYYMICYSLLVGTCVPAALLWFGGLRVLHSTPASVLIAFMLYQGQLLEYTGQLLNSFTSLLKSSGSGGEVFKLLRHKHDDRAYEEEAAEPFSGRVEFRDVNFSYGRGPALRGVCLVAEAGKFTAVVGASGAGKSTLFALLYALYSPSHGGGSVELDGRSVADMDPRWLRTRALGVVTQEPVLLSGTIAENILYCRLRAQSSSYFPFSLLPSPYCCSLLSLVEEQAEAIAALSGRARTAHGDRKHENEMEVAIQAAKRTHAHDFITALPFGYLTQVGEGGKNLSGGQKQRIAIARAIAHDPAVLCLDEATSALDAESERAVRTALDAASEGRTTLAIAHRLSSVKNAHRIFLLHNGTVLESGGHAELVAKNGAYAKLVSTQMLNDDDDETTTMTRI